MSDDGSHYTDDVRDNEYYERMLPSEQHTPPVPSADQIFDQLGYRRVDQRRKKATELIHSNSQPALAARTVSNGRVLNDFDNLMSNVRQLDVKHPRVAAEKLEKALWKMQGGTRG